MEVIVLVAFPGFIALWIHRLNARRRSRTGWDFLILSGLAGFASYAIAFAIVGFIESRTGSVAFGELADSLLELKEIDAPSYMLAFPVAVALGFVSHLLLYSPISTTFLVHWLGVRHPPAEPDLLSDIGETSGPVVVSMTNGQIYVGLVQGVTKDPDQDHKLIALAYFLSGTRIKSERETGVSFNYAVEYDPSNPKAIYLDFRNIVSVAEFNLSSFVSSIRDKYVRISEETLTDFLINLEVTHQISPSESEESLVQALRASEET